LRGVPGCSSTSACQGWPALGRGRGGRGYACTLHLLQHSARALQHEHHAMWAREGGRGGAHCHTHWTHAAATTQPHTLVLLPLMMLLLLLPPQTGCWRCNGRQTSGCSCRARWTPCLSSSGVGEGGCSGAGLWHTRCAAGVQGGAGTTAHPLHLSLRREPVRLVVHCTCKIVAPGPSSRLQVFIGLPPGGGACCKLDLAAASLACPGTQLRCSRSNSASFSHATLCTA